MQHVRTTSAYYDEVYDKKQAHIQQTGQPGDWCDHCRTTQGHNSDCPQVDVVSLGKRLRAVLKAQARAKCVAARYLNDLQRLTGKMALLKHENNKLRSANDRLRKSALRWQPIETAPTGKVVLVYLPGESAYATALLSPRGDWHESMTENLVAEPSHWMPLPEGPE